MQSPRSTHSMPSSPRIQRVPQTMPPGGLPPLNRPPSRPLAQMDGRDTLNKSKWNYGHDAFSAASVWLNNIARDGKRAFDRQTEEDVNNTGALTLRELRTLPLPAKRLVASSGCLTARELHKASKEDQDLFRPLTKEEKEMKDVLTAISEKAAQKFSSIRGALRHLDAEHVGTVNRSEIRYFFRAYDFPEEVADKFFDHFDEAGTGRLDYGFFVNFIRPFLEGAINGNPLTARDLTTVRGAPDKVFEDMLQAAEPLSGIESFKRQYPGILELMGRKAEDEFGTLAHTFRFVDSDRSGSIDKAKMRYLFRRFNIPEVAADRFFKAADANSSGTVSYQEFVTALRPYISDGAEMTTHRKKETGTPDTATPPGTAAPLSPARKTKTLAWRHHVDTDTQSELRLLMQDLGDKLPAKFKRMSDAFKCLDLERNGRITRLEMHDFFRGFGHSEAQADKVFDLLDQDMDGEINFKLFMSHFDRVLGQAFRKADRKPLIEVDNIRLGREVDAIAKAILDRLTTKYKNISEAFRALDLDKDGKVGKYEMRVFVKKLGLPADSADKFTAALDKDKTGYLSYHQFVKLFGSSSDAPPVEPLIHRFS
eukprot:TRINITY_DN33525_c0_g1_i1.p1 TRINITY_DN33525_c0_g1~~TRINITY_DN33525_c0_g1_i1.p1  ORF type:complete len:595 (-),score=132.43 TRINITY_DN33525_c0_g1_i1:75-1859(-)